MGKKVGAVILAAGMSTRMGQPKMVLPWGETTIIQTVVKVVLSAKISTITVVVGGDRELVEGDLKNITVRFVFNPLFQDGSMLHSVQAGILDLVDTDCDGAMVVLGDQPFIQKTTIEKVLQTYSDEGVKIIFPSYVMKRGHPWLVARELWDEILAIREPETLRDFTQKHVREIVYVNIDNDSIIRDLDTPNEYEKYKP